MDTRVGAMLSADNMIADTPATPRQEQIVRAALRLLADGSFDDLTTRRLAAELGLSQPAMFRHFDSREALLLAVVQQGAADVAAVVAPALRPDVSAPARLARLGAALLGHVEGNPGFPRLLFASLLPGEPSVRDAMREVVALQRARIEALVRDGQGVGAIDPAVPAEHAAGLFLALVQGRVVRWETDGRAGRPVDGYAGQLALWERAVGVVAAAPPLAREGPTFTLVDAVAILAAGTDPLATVLGAIEGLPGHGAVVIHAPFRPAPLVAMLRGRGLHVTEEPQDAGRWLVVASAGVIVDLRDLEPPEPLERVLCAALGSSPLTARVPRFPQLLLDRLAERAAAYDVCALPDGTALVSVRP